MEKLLKLDPGNTELLSQKQGLLNEKVQATKEKRNGTIAALALTSAPGGQNGFGIWRQVYIFTNFQTEFQLKFPDSEDIVQMDFFHFKILPPCY